MPVVDIPRPREAWNRLAPDVEAQIVEEIAAGQRFTDIAAKYKVSLHTVYNVNRRNG